MIKKLLPLNQSWEKRQTIKYVTNDKGEQEEEITLHPIDSLIFHTTLGTSALSSWAWLDHIDLSYHYIINDDGKVYKLVDHFRVAWHAGVVSKPKARVVSHFKGVNPNKPSIGIAFSRNGQEGLSQEQIEACVKLLKDNKWENLPMFTHNEITSYKPKEVTGYLAQVKEALRGDKGEDFRRNLLLELIAKLTLLIGQLTSQKKI
jgi:N-acetyl-anhydromuramyl-L-alanine amidase AmpD